MKVLVKPVITEKMTFLTERHEDKPRFGFIVDRRANKLQIKEAVEEIYDVTVVDVKTMIYGGKNKAKMTKSGYITGKTNSYKKAIVTLADGETIDFYSNI